MRIGRSLGLAVCSIVTLAPAFARAQQPALPQPGSEQITLPPPPAVEDPDLVPLPAAKRIITSWNEIRDLLRARSTDMRIAIDEVGRAEAQRRVQLANVLGSITAGGTYTHNFITNTATQFIGTNSSGQPCTLGTSDPACFRVYAVPTADYAQGSIQAALPIIAPRFWNAIHMADVNIDLKKASLDDVKRTIAIDVSNAALQVVTNEHITELNRVGLRQALERLDLAKRKTSLGAGTGLDVVRAQQDVENARATLVSGDETARQARETFGLSIGLAEDVSVGGDLSFEAITRQVLADCKPSPTIEQRPDIIAAREQVHEARLNTWDVKTQFFPTLTAQSALATTTADTGSFPATTWNIQGVLSWDIWEGGARYGNLRDANLQVLEAQEKLESARRNAVIQVVQADRGVKVAQQSREVAQRSRDLSKEVDRLTRAGFLTGAFTSLDLVTAAAALRQAEINLALAEFSLVKAQILDVLTLATCPL